MRLGKYILTFTILVIGINLFAQTDTVQYGKLEVKVIDGMTKKPLEFVRVSVSINGKKAFKYTDIDGECTFDKIQYGKHLISIGLSGYKKTDNFEIEIQKNKTNLSKTLQSLNDTNVFVTINQTIHYCFRPEKEIENFSHLRLLIIDSITKKPIEFATVKLEAKDFIRTKLSDSDGEIVFDSLSTKTYRLSVMFVGYYKKNYEKVFIDNLTDTFIKIELKERIKLVNIIKGRPKLIKPDEPTQQNFKSYQIMHMPF